MFGCAPQGQQLTGTSEQGNAKFSATLYTQAGYPATGLTVILRRRDYVTSPAAAIGKVQADSGQTATDGTGGFVIDSLDTGAYCVEATDKKAFAVLLQFSVGAAKKPINWGPDTVRPFAAVRGAIDPAASKGKRFVQVYGLERLDPVDSSGTFAVSDLPQGTYTIRIVAADSANGLPEFDGISAKAGAVTTIGRYSSWKDSAVISLNTTGNGAAISENVLGFPVLIRLSSPAFDFSSALSGGKDVRFAKSDGAPLHFQIERWDASLGRAEIWVRVDTVYANDSSQSIRMFWGNPASSAQSDGAMVFDTADGYEAVWHLADAGDTIYDATSNRFHGVRHGNIALSSGMIGGGQAFGGGGGYCDMGNVCNPGMNNFTASAWVRRDTTGLQTIFAKSTGGSPHADYGWSLSFGLADQLHCYIASGGSSWGAAGAFDFWSKSDAVVTDTTTWHYIVAVVDRANGKNCKTYIDGVDVTGNSNGTIGAVGSLSNQLSLRIGAETDTSKTDSSTYQWTGSIDECVISRTVRSAAWLRLCFGNQGPVDHLVRFR